MPNRLVAAAALAVLVAGCAELGLPQPAAEGAGSSPPKGRTAAALPDVTTVAPTAKTYVSTRELNLRTGPNHRYEAKTVLPPGTVVTPNGYVSGSWWQVDTEKYGTGWVDSTGLNPAG